MNSETSPNNPKRILSGQHPITTDEISKNALKVLATLERHGYEAYLVGGSIRDIYLGITPKDFDIATNALPDEIQKCFKNCRLIGRRFRLAHIRFGREIIEVATFRAQAKANNDDHHVDGDTGMLVRDNVYGSIEDDVCRRDFTINALYYSREHDMVLDYMNSIDDLSQRTLKMIGTPSERYLEDPVRMLRAVRHVAKLDLAFDAEAKRAIPECLQSLEHIAPARLFEEYIKLFLKGAAVKTFELLKELDLFQFLFPACYRTLLHEAEYPQAKKLVLLALKNTDARIQADKTINPAFLIAVFLFTPFEEELQHELSYQHPHNKAVYLASTTVLRQQSQHLSIPKRFSQTIKDMWSLQYRLQQRTRKHVYRCLEHPKFRAAYDLMCLRAEVNPKDKKLKENAAWWTTLQEVDSNEKKNMIAKLRGPAKKRKEHDA